jgi:hypothetical protein
MTTYKFNQDEMDDMTARWRRLGQRPKLFLRLPGKVTEFTGYHFLVDEHGVMPGTGCPDIARNMIAAATSLAPGPARALHKGEDMEEVSAVASASLACAAASFAERLPTLAEFYLRNSREWMNRGNLKHVELDHGQIMKIAPEIRSELFPERWKNVEATEKILKAGSKIGDLLHQVETKISMADVDTEARHVAAKGICTEQQWKDLMAMHMDVGPDTDVQAYRQALREYLQRPGN